VWASEFEGGYKQQNYVYKMVKETIFKRERQRDQKVIKHGSDRKRPAK